MNSYAPKPDAPLPITLNETEEMKITPLAFAEQLKEQYAKGEPVTILYSVHRTKWDKFIYWIKRIWNKLRNKEKS